jgi:hypothetical protein
MQSFSMSQLSTSRSFCGFFTIRELTNGIVLHNLTIFRKYSLYETTVDDWTCILDLAHRWQFDEAKNLAVRELEKIYISPIDRICLYQKYQVDEILLVPLYAMLCAREEPLNIDESEKLGMKTVVGVYHARERLRANPNDGGKSPLPPDLKQDEIHAAIKSLFGIASPVSAVEAAAGTWIGDEFTSCPYLTVAHLYLFDRLGKLPFHERHRK